MGLDAIPSPSSGHRGEWNVIVATASLDATAKLFRLQPGDGSNEASDEARATDKDEKTNDEGDTTHNRSIDDETDVPMKDASIEPPREHQDRISVTELAHLKGHAARLCRVAFHPMRKHVATTSFDHTWRLWDAETSQSLLLQDGHAKECYGVGFHPDGGLVSTTDLGGIVHLWDLRTSKSIAWYRSHAGKVLNAEFHPNGSQLATAGEDGCIHVFDLRRRPRVPSSVSTRAPLQATSSPLVSIPAHNNIVTSLRFDARGEALCSSSFDGTVKIWNCRSWKLLNRLQGHQGKVTSADMMGMAGRDSDDRRVRSRHAVVTAGFDRTVKLWT
jgi:U4/U6 small nuclear ribonucleoprotein PRP4